MMPLNIIEMKNFVFILLINLVVYEVSAHDIRLATYEINLSREGYTLDINFDKIDLQRSLVNNYPENWEQINNEGMNGYIEMYLESNLQLSFNAQCVDINIESIVHDEEYIRVHASLSVKIDDVVTIEVANTCLIDYNDRYSNVVRSNLNGRSRSFHLNNERIRTVIDYREGA